MHLGVFIRQTLEIGRLLLAGEAMQPAQSHRLICDLTGFQILLHCVGLGGALGGRRLGRGRPARTEAARNKGKDQHDADRSVCPAFVQEILLFHGIYLLLN